ncbi:MAG: phage major capsid protein [Oscillospiraceae bacterium]|nr:phage major capsid protein [Oscillospiraceae bacterium]
MEKILSLREERSKLWDTATAFLKCKEDESGKLSAEDSDVYAKMEADVLDLGRQIERLERARDITTDIANTLDNPILNAPVAHNALTSPHSNSHNIPYRAAFWNAMRYKMVTNDLNTGVDSQGGYLVPDEFNGFLVKSLTEHNVMRQLARVIQTSHGSLQIPIASAKGTAAWINEVGTIPVSDEEFGQVTLGAHKLGTMIKVSHELLNDSEFSVETFLASDFGRRIGTLEEEAFIIGDGKGKPTGAFTSAQTVKSGSGADLTFDDVMTLYHELKSPYRSKAVFLCNDMTVKALRQIKDNSGQYIWAESLTAGTPSTLIGHPVYVSRFVPTIESGAKVMAFGDFSHYWIGDRQGRTFERLNELFAHTDQVGFKAVQRVDGKLVLPEAVQVLQMGTDS